MEATERAVVRLTEPHTELTEAGAVDWPPLLVWLDESVARASGRRGSSAGGGLPLNTDALTLSMIVHKRAGLMGQALNLPLTGNHQADVVKLWRKAKTEYQSGRLEEVQWEMIGDEFPDWVRRIEALDDRPRTMELTVACPRCGNRWVSTSDGSRQAAVRIEFREGEAPTAECQHEECDAIWAGWADIALLGFAVGAEQDLLVLKSAGIDIVEGMTTV